MRRREPIFRWLTGWLLLAALGVGALGGAGLSVRAAPRQQVATNIVISEFRFRGPDGGNDEFIEIYNPTSSQVDISDWRIWGSNNSGGTGTSPRYIFPANTFLQSGQYYLITNNNATAGYSGTVPGDDTYGTGITDDGGIALTLPDNTSIVDAVGLSSGSAYQEGATLASLGSTSASNLDRGYERKAGGNVGSCFDSNDNVADFQIRTPSNPQNLSSPTTTCGYLPLSVIISEVAWMGTLASSDDEWIELYNPGSSTITLDNWRLVADDGSPDIVLSGTIPGGGSGGYFLLERARELVTDASSDQIFFGALDDTNEILRLRAPDGTIVDTANSDSGSWPAGTISPNGSMERMGIITDGTLAWVTNVEATTWTNTDASGQLVHGTPGRENWGFGVTHTPIPPPTSTPPPTAPLTIVINEVAWAGTQASTSDEWIELYNPGSKDISLNGWSLRAADGSPDISLSGTIAAGNYFLLERTDEDVTTISSDMIYTGSLSNNGEILRLYDQNGYVVDTANSNGGAWPAGISNTYSSMERSVIATDSNFVWVTYDASKDKGIKAKDASGNEIKGTPGRGNAQTGVAPTATPSNTPRAGSGSGSGSSGSSGGTVLTPLLGISEFLPRPGHDYNNDGLVDVFDEFIEIINAGKIDVNLGDYRVDDEQNLGSPSYSLPSITLKPGERAVFYASETGVLLSDAGDTVRLLRGSSTVVDAYTYGVVRYPDQAWCRIPDRLGYWNKPCFPTPGNPNALAGTFPLPPGGPTGYRPPLCLLPDTTPEQFVYAECEAGGDEIWNRKYWDGLDAAELLFLEEVEKWGTVFE